MRLKDFMVVFAPRIKNAGRPSPERDAHVVPFEVALVGILRMVCGTGHWVHYRQANASKYVTIPNGLPIRLQQPCAIAKATQVPLLSRFMGMGLRDPAVCLLEGIVFEN